jgi:Cu/Zn superoxide dismutase
MFNHRLIGVVSIIAIVGGGFAYGCSDDEETGTKPPTTTTDAGGKTDGTTGTDSGGGNDTGTKTDTGTTDTGTGDTSTTKTAHVTITAVNDSGVSGTGTFTQSGTNVTLTVNVTGAPPGPRGTHVHVNADCSGGHYNPNAATKNGEFDNTVVDDAGVGTGTSTRDGLDLVPKSDAGTGIVNRALAIHGIAPLDIDGGALLDDAGLPIKAPVIGCGEILAN